MKIGENINQEFTSQNYNIYYVIAIFVGLIIALSLIYTFRLGLKIFKLMIIYWWGVLILLLLYLFFVKRKRKGDYKQTLD